MCEIEYEEFDNKEIIYQELKNMSLDNENEYRERNINENSKEDEPHLEENRNNSNNEINKKKNEEKFETLYKIENEDISRECCHTLSSTLDEIKKEFAVISENISLETLNEENRQENKLNEGIFDVVNVDEVKMGVKKDKRTLKVSEIKQNEECLTQNLIKNIEYKKTDKFDEGLNGPVVTDVKNDRDDIADKFVTSSEIDNKIINNINESKVEIKAMNRIPTKEDLPPKRLSELFSQYNISWKDRLKSKPIINHSTYTNNDNKKTIYDNETIPSSSKLISKQTICVESSCYDDSDETVDVISQIKEETVKKNNFELSSASSNSFVTNKPLYVDSDCTSSSDKIIALLSKKDISLTNAISGCDSDNKSDNKVNRKPVCVESSGFSASDEMMFKRPNKSAASHSFGCGFDFDESISAKVSLKPITVDSSSNEMSKIKSNIFRKEISPSYGSELSNNNTVVKNTTSCSTETSTDNDVKSQRTFSNQIDETYNSLEEKILPFIKSPHTVELRLKGRLSVFQRACVKEIATQNKLLIKQFGKGKDGYMLLRKKIELVTAQKLFLEMKRNNIKKQQEKIAEVKAKQERLLNPPLKVSSGCQADFSDEKDEPVQLSKNAARKNRKKQWEDKQKQLAKRNSETQTLPKGFYLCPYCEGDIPESHQAIHYPYCLSKYRSQQQYSAKIGQNNKEKKSVSMKNTRPMSSDRKQRSKSRDKIHHSTLDTIKKELDKIHDNDINSMVNVLNELNKKCSVSGCNKKKQKTCDECMVGYCCGHYSPDINTSTKHFNCPVALEKAELERSKKLGINNPLLKTVEELTAPRFADGALIKKTRRMVKVVEPAPLLDSTVNNSSPIVSNILPPNINETRLRNGPILSFERNELHKKLREKIGNLSDRRTK